VVAYNPGLLAGCRKQVQHTVLESNPEEAAAPIEVAHRVAVEAVEAVHMAVEAAAPIVAHRVAVEAVQAVEAAAPIVAHRVAAEAVQAVHMAVEVAHTVTEAAAPDLAAAVGLDHKTWIIPSCQICDHF
jgi:hypothetical protein